MQKTNGNKSKKKSLKEWAADLESQISAEKALGNTKEVKTLDIMLRRVKREIERGKKFIDDKLD